MLTATIQTALATLCFGMLLNTSNLFNMQLLYMRENANRKHIVMWNDSFAEVFQEYPCLARLFVGHRHLSTVTQEKKVLLNLPVQAFEKPLPFYGRGFENWPLAALDLVKFWWLRYSSIIECTWKVLNKNINPKIKLVKIQQTKQDMEQTAPTGYTEIFWYIHSFPSKRTFKCHGLPNERLMMIDKVSIHGNS
jgi:hypothetical protein